MSDLLHEMITLNVMHITKGISYYCNNSAL